MGTFSGRAFSMWIENRIAVDKEIEQINHNREKKDEKKNDPEC